MVIDVLMPSYGAPNPQAAFKLATAIDYCRCKCGMYEIERQIENPEYRPVFHNLDECPNGKHDVYMHPCISMAVCHWARNTMVMQRRKNATHILFVDSDIGIEPDHIERLLLHDVDIVAGLCTMRVDPAIPNIRMWMEHLQNYGEIVKWGNEMLMEVDAVGTGFMLIRNSALETIAEEYHAEAYRRNGNGWWFENLWLPHIGGELGEDISFCLKAQRLGIPIYVDTSIQPLHYDYYGYSIPDYLPFQEERIAGLLAGSQPKPEEIRA